jgi:hypothetical protein
MANMRRITLLLISSLGAGALAGCGETEIPERPTYTHDIKPLVEAHCIRCHGAGGQLNQDPDITGVVAGNTLTNGDFTSLQDDASGKHGLLYYTTPAGATFWNIWFPKMPPTPAPALTERELTIFQRWYANPLP